MVFWSIRTNCPPLLRFKLVYLETSRGTPYLSVYFFFNLVWFVSLFFVKQTNKQKEMSSPLRSFFKQN